MNNWKQLRIAEYEETVQRVPWTKHSSRKFCRTRPQLFLELLLERNSHKFWDALTITDVLRALCSYFSLQENWVPEKPSNNFIYKHSLHIWEHDIRSPFHPTKYLHLLRIIHIWNDSDSLSCPMQCSLNTAVYPTPSSKMEPRTKGDNPGIIWPRWKVIIGLQSPSKDFSKDASPSLIHKNQHKIMHQPFLHNITKPIKLCFLP